MNLHDRENFLVMSTFFLGGMLLVAMLLATFAGLNPFGTIHLNWPDVGVGLVAAVIMFLVFSRIESVRGEAELILRPALMACHWYDLILLATLVGIIEEILFRGVLEPWVALWNPVVALIVVNLFFGLLHSISRLYFIVATVLGVLLSLLAHGLGEYNLLRPIVAHAFYDYICFLVIIRTPLSEPEEV